MTKRSQPTKDQLWRRGNRWYLRLYLPTRLRPFFLSAAGKQQDTIVEPLADLGYEAARIECGERVTAYRRVFARAALMTPEAIRDEIDAIKQHAAGRRTIADLPLLQSEIERVASSRPGGDEWLGHAAAVS